ncbi:nitroreductase family deazaflavin-dependent oxidoreductase [Rhodococcus sp. BP-252]|uniref:nitroreductase/quinone reductase family protein n=1 Tax=unclassified Rhodococcus (in: high G+C Gram-positive bacteria) TaxID=192944 RepID=UPI001431025C|nr:MULTISPECIES: nitroreductase/quinone reductase family protein [unclassified Rhodococcus (in: high G+C Gram-positive bacteria)]MBY6412511.1 nitroreductase family deazaflavin-dependent oxidoreductase [Rhodococcus sp. BP-320]MBY6417234.1 nitroreductase family deazaflavin-dependent oxidoreductase [Rhodococcus sp. BP-321]MBY6424159.1 nitroreductase family deazaflavin-dependent oxidoreductase [Rhodococcus sp. BP-324]MBY6427258.1 nitroreductase family deazaflavin-dependent oxidoreductase [Rhodococc
MAESPFPDVRWGSENSIIRKPAIAFAATKPGSWVIRNLAGIDRRLLERTDGKYTILGPIAAPVVLLTTTGRKSGTPRTSPLLYYREGDTLYVVGSNFGQQHHPAWTSNLLADPHATVAIGGKRIPVTATPVLGDEKVRIYDAFNDMVRVYGEYKTRTDREMRMFALTAD